MYTVYIIYSKNFNVFYKGITTDIKKRLFEHNSNLSRYTSKKGPWVLVYTKLYDFKKDALIEEKRLKKLNRISIEKLINENMDG